MELDNSLNTASAGSGDAALHIAFGVDSSYFRGMGVAIASVIKNNPQMRFVFHVFAFSVSDDSRRRIALLEQQYAIRIHIHVLSPHALDEFRNFPCFAHHSLGTFIRLLIPDLLQGITKRVLYLDADLLCLGNMQELLAIDIDNCVAAAVHDQLDTTARTQIAALKLPVAEYFNAGVMYINVDNWIANNTQVQALTALSTQELLFADQDALNIALNGRIRFIDDKWNYRYHLVDFLSKGHSRLDVTAPVVFMHFTGPVKPWHDWCLHEAKSIFIGYQNLSSWADMPLDQPRSARELKLFSKFLVKQGRTLEGSAWHVKYLWKRSAVSLKRPGKR